MHGDTHHDGLYIGGMISVNGCIGAWVGGSECVCAGRTRRWRRRETVTANLCTDGSSATAADSVALGAVQAAWGAQEVLAGGALSALDYSGCKPWEPRL